MSQGDWIDQMVQRGLLSPAQAEATRRAGSSSQDAAPLPSPATPESSSLPSLSLPLVYSCAACARVFTVSGPDAASQCCPLCKGPLRAMELGSLITPSADRESHGSGRRFGRYILRREIGHGGMGVVYEAHDTALNRRVALKMLDTPGKELVPEMVERLKREARAAGKLRHPSIVAVYDVDQVDGRHFFTMDYVDGTSFDAVLKNDREMREYPVRRRVEILAQVAEALACAHTQGVVHRDIKPSNVMIDGTGRAMLMDFGLARDESGGSLETITRSNAVLGTPEYLSPEQAARSSHHAGPASDVFSFGILFFTALTGQLPFPGTHPQILYGIVHSEPAAFPDKPAEIPRDLRTLCFRCLEKNPSRRFPDATPLAAELRRFLAGKPIETRPEAWFTRFFKNLVRKPALQDGGAQELKQFEEDRERSLVSARAQAEAVGLFEQGRPALEVASRYLYDREANYDELVRRVDVGQRLIERGLEKCKDLALGHYLLGRAWEIKGWDDKAEASWREALRLDPGLAAANFYLGRLLIERAYVASLGMSNRLRVAHAPAAQRVAAEARTQIDKALGHGSGFEDELEHRVVEALEAALKGDTAAAVEMCKLGIATYQSAQGREEFWWVLGNALTGDEQIRAYDEAIRIRPRYAMALFSRGRILTLRAEYEAAIADYTEALHIKPRFLAALSNRGHAHMVRLKWTEAHADLDAAVTLKPDFLPALINRGRVRVRLGDAERGLADLRHAVQIDPALGISCLTLVEAFCFLKRHEEGRLEADRGLQLAPDDADLLQSRGVALTGLGRSEEAEKDFSRSLELEPGNPHALLGRGELMMSLKRWDRAEADFKSALAIGPPGWSERGEVERMLQQVRDSRA